MAMVVKNNVTAQLVLGELNKNTNKLGKDLKKVSTGMKINSAEDDASGYSISERMRVQIRGLDQDNQNAQNAGSLLKTAEGAVSSTIDVLKTMKEKAINAANDTNTDADRATIQKELDQSIDQLDDNAGVTFNGKTLFDGAADYSENAQQTIVKALNSEWMDSALQLVKDTYGISFDTGSPSVKNIDLQFKRTGGSDLASVTSTSLGGTTVGLTLNVNLDYYEKLNLTDPNGSTRSAGAGYLDRTLAHEFTHAVMSANIQGFLNMPLYIVEGAAEYTHGIDDQRIVALSNLTASTITTEFGSGPNGSGGEKPYAVGYAFLHYLNAHGGQDSGTTPMKRFMRVLAEQGGNALDAAVSAATKGTFSTAKEAQTAMLADLNATTASGGTIQDFYKKYTDIDMTNKRDTGSATGSKSGHGDEENAQNIVLEGRSTKFWWYPSSNSTTIDGLTIDWGDFERPHVQDAGFKFQIGTKANQNIHAIFSDIHADALGLQDSNGKKLSVATRPDAKRALTILDRSLQKALDQATTIGALESRLDYTRSNLTTASENVQSAESTIRDADMAKEMTAYTKDNVLSQASQSMLAQANQNLGSVLSLLQ